MQTIYLIAYDLETLGEFKTFKNGSFVWAASAPSSIEKAREFYEAATYAAENHENLYEDDPGPMRITILSASPIGLVE